MQVYLTPTHLAIAMEYAKGGNLLDFLASRQQPLSEKAARRLFQQVRLADSSRHTC
jgi:serine/threonine protein kinase